jgi:putative DNA primase/helicase
VDGKLMRVAKLAMRLRLHSSSHISDEDKRQEEAKWALHSESLPRLEAMLKLARSEKLLADDGRNWDSDPWLLGVANGVVDLRTGNLRPGAPEDRITLHTDVSFDPEAQCPRWIRFQAEVFDDDSELIAYVRRAVGYSLTGETSEQSFFCNYGDGANGKTTFLNAVRHVFGYYASNLPFSAFELTARSAISNDVATLPGKRFVTAIETDESARLNEARIKALTGGDLITARRLYGEYFTFKPLAKFWLAFNHRPLVSDDSHGFWRRVHLIPFVRQFNPQADPGLEVTLRTEAPGILAWAVRGCIEWQTQGLNPPAIVVAATQAYREESDPIRVFIEDRCVLHPKAYVRVAVLWQAFVDWSVLNREARTLRRHEFSRRLESMGMDKVRVGQDRNWTWVGICLKEGAQPWVKAVAPTVADVDLK